MLAQTLHNVLQTTSCNIVVYLEIIFDKLYEPKETQLPQRGGPISEPKKTGRNTIWTRIKIKKLLFF